MSTVFKYDRSVVEKAPERFSYVDSSYIDKFVQYVLNSDYRQAVALKPWLKKQVTGASPELVAFANNISTGKNHDETALNVLSAVIHYVRYVPDGVVWNMPEYWQTAEETFSKRTGDCEDGAILMYVICRLKGIPANRLMLFCGNVRGGGHCWLGYRADEYPLNWVFLDWCYWATEKSIERRLKYYIDDKTIIGDENYYSLWFGFQEDKSVLGMKYDTKRKNK